MQADVIGQIRKRRDLDTRAPSCEEFIEEEWTTSLEELSGFPFSFCFSFWIGVWELSAGRF
jgi:hypothetical protein